MIDKVNFTLHETFGDPNISKKSAPFDFQCVGWGIFEIPIKITWKRWLKMPPTEMTHMLSFEGNGSHKSFVIKVDKKLLQKECGPVIKETGIQRLIRKKQLGR